MEVAYEGAGGLYGVALAYSTTPDTKKGEIEKVDFSIYNYKKKCLILNTTRRGKYYDKILIYKPIWL